MRRAYPMDPGLELASSTAYGSTTGNLDPNPRIKSPLLRSRVPRRYLRLHACTSEDMSLTCNPPYRTMTATTGLYRRIRASTERARDRIGLDQSDETRQSRPGIPAWRTARGNTECDRRCRSPMMASLSRARSWAAAMRNGGDGLGPDVYLRCTYHVPRIDLGPASRPVDPPAASGSCRSEAASAVLAPHRVTARDHHPGLGDQVSWSPPRHPSVAMVARSVTRPEASMRPNPYTTSGRPGGLASGIGRPAPGLSCRRRPGLAAGMTGATGPGSHGCLPDRRQLRTSFRVRGGT